MNAFDKSMMELAISEAEIHPDGPLAICVGAVLVDVDGIAYTGWRETQVFGNGPDLTMHAEQMALLRAGWNTHGGTLYVTLEPCTVRRTDPIVPCAECIIATGVRRVVVGAALHTNCQLHNN